MEAILRAIPKRLVKTVEELLTASEQSALERVEELRFRVGKPVQVVRTSGELLLRREPVFNVEEAIAMLSELCGHSVYAREQELVNGFITLPGGARVGLSGKPIFENGRISRFTSVSGFDIRIPRAVVGCAEPFMKLLTDGGAQPVSAVIAAPPGEGKTTFLRDCARCFSNGVGLNRAFLTAVSDERNELSAWADGVQTHDLGLRTDVMTGVPKAVAIPMLVRNLAPEVIITDELMGKPDAAAFSEATAYGVAVIASVHAGSYSDLAGRDWLMELPGTVRLFLLKREQGRFMLSAVNSRSIKPC